MHCKDLSGSSISSSSPRFRVSKQSSSGTKSVLRSSVVQNPMASASSFAEEDLVDPQVQKTEESAAEMTTETVKKKKKKILCEEPESYVKYVLSYKPQPLMEPEVPEFLVKNDPVLAANMYVMMANMALYDEYTKEETLEKQRNFRQQLKTQSKVTYEIEVDEDDDRYETVAGGSAGGKGRRRHRPGVMKKQDGNTMKLN